MRAGDRNALSIAKFICIKFDLATAMLAEANNQTWLSDRRLFVGPAALGWAAVGAAAVQVDQNVARSGAFAGANNAAVLKLIHDSSGTPIAEAQAALEEGDAALL